MADVGRLLELAVELGEDLADAAKLRSENDRMAAAGYGWTFSAITASPGAGALYHRLRNNGQYHAPRPTPRSTPD